MRKLPLKMSTFNFKIEKKSGKEKKKKKIIPLLSARQTDQMVY